MRIWDEFVLFHTLKSDTPRGAGGLMSWAASKAVGPKSRRRAKARLYQQLKTVRLFHPRFPARGCIGGPAPAQILPWKLRNREPRNARRRSFDPSHATGQSR